MFLFKYPALNDISLSGDWSRTALWIRKALTIFWNAQHAVAKESRRQPFSHCGERIGGFARDTYSPKYPYLWQMTLCIKKVKYSPSLQNICKYW